MVSKCVIMDDQLLILKNFPLLLPHNREFTFYDGFMRVKGAEFRISLNVPHYPALTDLHLECSWDMSALLQGKENTITQLLKTCSTLHEFLEALRTLTGPSVASMYRVFCQQVASLQKFWTVMRDIDSSCWVIDPEEPRLCDTARRIIIGENVSLQLQVNPWDPCSRPDIKFLGPEKTVSEFREKLIYRLEEWDSESSLPNNLKSVLGLESFPEKPEGTDEDESSLMIRPGECFVCFSIRLEGSLPSEACPSEHCGSIFHKDCLYQLLMSLPNSHRSFNRISGECPSCGAAISCPLPG